MTMGLEFEMDVAQMQDRHQPFHGTCNLEKMSAKGVSLLASNGRHSSDPCSALDRSSTTSTCRQANGEVETRALPARPPSPDFSHLNAEERERIVEVLRKLQAEERKDMRYIRTDLRDRAVSTTKSSAVGTNRSNGTGPTPLQHVGTGPSTSEHHNNLQHTQQLQEETCTCCKDLLRSCSRWTRDGTSSDHQCELRRRHLALSGSWYHGVNALQETSSLCSYLISKAAVADYNVSVNVTNADGSQQLPAGGERTYAAMTTGRHSSSSSLSSVTSSSESPDVFASDRNEERLSPLPPMTPSPRCSFDSGIGSLETSTGLQPILQSAARRKSSVDTLLRQTRRVSFSSTLQHVRTYDPASSTTSMIKVVQILQDDHFLTTLLEPGEVSVMTSFFNMVAATTASPPSSRPASCQSGRMSFSKTSEKGDSVKSRISRRSLTPAASPINGAGPLQIDLDDIEDNVKVGHLQIALQRSRLVDGRITYNVHIAKGNQFTFTTTVKDSSSKKASSSAKSGKNSPLATSSSSSPASSFSPAAVVTSAKQAGQLYVKCHMIAKSGDQQHQQRVGKFFRLQSKRSMVASSQNPNFADEFAAVVKENDLPKIRAIRISVLQRKYTGLLRRPVTTVFGTVTISMTTSYDGMRVSGAYTLRSEHQPASAVPTPPFPRRRESQDSLVAPPSDMTTVRDSNSLRRSSRRQLQNCQRAKMAVLRRWGSSEDLSDTGSTPIKRFGSVDNLLV